MRHAVPEHQGDMPKVADVRRFAFNQKGIRHGREKVSAIALLYHSQGRQAIEDNAGRARIRARRSRDFVSGMNAIMNQREKIIFDGSVEDPHQRPRRNLLRLLVYHVTLLYKPSFFTYW